MLRMRTATIEGVMGPVAQLVGEFILTLDDEQLVLPPSDAMATNAGIVADTVGGILTAVDQITKSTRVRRPGPRRLSPAPSPPPPPPHRARLGVQDAWLMASSVRACMCVCV
jgi:hypothetical protein